MGRQTRNTIDAQLKELALVRHPGALVDDDVCRRELSSVLAGGSVESYGNWIHFPWTNLLVRLLSESDFWELKTSSNRNKVLPEEQAVLRRARVGIIGLSVGQEIALLLAMEGIGSHFKMADFDTVSVANTNRISCGVQCFGMNKAVLAAHRVHEINPYIEISCFSEGVSLETVDDFLVGGGRLDLVFEQCDDFYSKILVRERCRSFRIPVIMDTNDRGLLDVERFDLEHDRRLLHGLLGDIDAGSVGLMGHRERLALGLKMLGGAPSPRMAASLDEMGRTIRSWPQLASEVGLGAALAVSAARRVILRSLTASGRISVDLDEILVDKSFARSD
jgi:molybdopterin/thiamine biosynthesis adenylyltransferase